MRTLVAAGANVNAVALTPTTDISTKNTKRRVLCLNDDFFNAYTPLHCILQYCSKDNNAHALSIVRLLLANGADANAIGGDGITPLGIWTRRHFAFPGTLAIDRECLLLEELLSAGARLSLEQDKYQSLAHIAVHSSNDRLLNLYYAYGGDLDFYDASGLTPLHLAHGYRSKEMLERLLHLKAHVDAVDADGWCVFDALVNETSEGISAGEKHAKRTCTFTTSLQKL